MTFPITNTNQLLYAIPFSLDGVTLSVRDSHGNQLELSGVEEQLNDAEEIVGFVLVVGPNEGK